MALANICKEEVDPLLAQIKDIMDQQKQNLENNLTDEDTLTSEQIADLSSDKVNVENYNNAMTTERKGLTDCESIKDLSFESDRNMAVQSMTVDRMLRELLTPLLTSWLEVNLSPLVKEIVEAKIEKLIAEYQLTLEKDKE